MDMKKFLKNFFLQNHLSDFEILSQECSWGECSQECSWGDRLQNFDPSINMALVNGGFLHHMDLKKFLKNFFLQNHLSDFEILSQECSWGDSFQKLMAKLWSVYKYGSGEGGFLLYTDMKKFLKNLVFRNRWSDSLKLLVRFWNNLIEMFLERPFSELFLKFWSDNKHGISEWRLLALYRH